MHIVFHVTAIKRKTVGHAGRQITAGSVWPMLKATGFLNGEYVLGEICIYKSVGPALLAESNNIFVE